MATAIHLPISVSEYLHTSYDLGAIFTAIDEDRAL
jgi:hypothetical protein